MEKRIRVLMCGSDIRTVKGGMVTVEKKLSGISGLEKGRDNLYSNAYRGKSAEKVPVLCRWLVEGSGLPDQKAGRYFTSAYGRARKLLS